MTEYRSPGVNSGVVPEVPEFGGYEQTAFITLSSITMSTTKGYWQFLKLSSIGNTILRDLPHQ